MRPPRPLGPFARAVRRIVRGIPRGRVLSYGEVALRAGRPGGARAVVRALHQLDDVPWWRVVRSDGTLAPLVAMPTLFVVSDLHLGETGLARMFHDQSQGMRFAELCSLVARTPDSELVLLGDIFDVTASLPP